MLLFTHVYLFLTVLTIPDCICSIVFNLVYIYMKDVSFNSYFIQCSCALYTQVLHTFTPILMKIDKNFGEFINNQKF